MAAHHPLRVWRFENQVTLEEFAEVVEVDASTLSRIEQRQLRPSMSLAERIAHATGGVITPNDFVNMPIKAKAQLPRHIRFKRKREKAAS